MAFCSTARLAAWAAVSAWSCSVLRSSMDCSSATSRVAKVCAVCSYCSARALGEAELAASSVEGRMLEVQKLTLDAAGSARLDQIRASLAGTGAGPALEPGSAGAGAGAGGTGGPGSHG